MKTSSGKHSPETIRNVVQWLSTISAGLDAIAYQMETNGVAPVDVDCQSALERAQKDLNRWRKSLFDAATDAMLNVGAFDLNQKGELAPDQPSTPDEELAAKPTKKRAVKKATSTKSETEKNP